MSDAAISTRGLVREFGDFTAVDQVDLDIGRGEIYGFLGPNGAGKSTTVRMLCTLLAPSGGTATVAGYDVGSQPGDVRLHIGVALQDAALDPKQTGRELLRLQGLLYGLPKKAMGRRVDELGELGELGELIDLTDALDRPIGTYSGGMRRRLDLVAALVHNPEILFLDEPTTGLDPASRASVWAEVRRLNDQLGMTIFLTTQYLEEADELCGRVGIINRGKIVAEGSPDELKRSVGADVVASPNAADALRGVPRDLEAVSPPVFIALFFFVVNIATLSKLTKSAGPGFDYKAFQMPTAILLGVTGISRAPALVLDIQNGYFDRLMTPVRRLAILLGHMVADIAVAMALTAPVLALGFAIGVRFETGVLGVVAFVELAALWSLAFSGFGYAIALKTGNPAAVNSTFLLFFPFLFLTSSYVPRSQLSGWLHTVAGLNPVTYLLEALRSLVSQGWEWSALGKGVLAIALLSILSLSMCFAALRGRIQRGG